jgi:hypothetical protein
MISSYLLARKFIHRLNRIILFFSQVSKVQRAKSCTLIFEAVAALQTFFQAQFSLLTENMPIRVDRDCKKKKKKKKKTTTPPPPTKYNKLL